MSTSWTISSGQSSIPDNFCLKNEEFQLFNKINELRNDYDKKSIQLSASLCYVAQTHVNDLLTNQPDTSICNLSSWSDKGTWTPCCYNAYIPDPECMWDKPKQLTPYPYRGYEFVAYFDQVPHVDSIIALFSDTREVLNMILTQEKYEKKRWLCAGVGINEHYVSIWFGQRKDVLPIPNLCTGALSDTMVSQTTKSESTYYLVFGSFENTSDAKEAIKQIKKSGFKYAGIVTKNGKSRVYLNKYDSLKEAMFGKQQLSGKYSEAWILKE